MLDISNDIELKNGKSNPFGWSQEEVHYEGKRIGFLECGAFDMDEGYSVDSKKEGDVTRVFIYKDYE